MALKLSPVWDNSKSIGKLTRVVDDLKAKLTEFERYVQEMTSAENKQKFFDDPHRVYTFDFDLKTATPCEPKTRDECMQELWGQHVDEMYASCSRKIKRVVDAEFELELETDFLKNHVEMWGPDVIYLNAAQPESPKGVEGFYKVHKVNIIYKAHTIQAYEMTLVRVMKESDVLLIGYTYIVPKCALPSKGIGISYITPRAEIF
jgi:hypothetical protein